MSFIRILMMIFIGVFTTISGNAQNETFLVKQSQISDDCENFVALSKNDVYVSVSFNDKYLRYNLSNGGYIDKPLNEMEKIIYNNYYALDYIEERHNFKVATRIVMIKDPNGIAKYKPLFIFMGGVGLIELGKKTCMKFVFENEDKI